MKTEMKVRLDLLIGDPVMATIKDAPQHLKDLYKNEELKLGFFKSSVYGALGSEGVACIKLNDRNYYEVPPPIDEKLYEECKTKFDIGRKQPIDGLHAGGSGSGKSFYAMKLIKGKL